MDKLIELLQQIQELAGVAVDALKGASSGDHGAEGAPPEHQMQGGGGQPEHQAPAGGGGRY